VAAVHGGPGAGGEMAPVAGELASLRGILEPIQTADSLEGQVEELKTVLETDADPPVALVGFSWGAWLSLLVAARHPELVAKLILVGAGPFEERYTDGIHQTRMDRLAKAEKTELRSLMATLASPEAGDRSRAFVRFGALFAKTDACDPLPDDPSDIEFREDIYLRVWPEAAEFRKSGNLLALAGRVRCPVLAIHGDYDPHPAEGVEKPLSAALADFRFILLKHCGHKPWTERRARGIFYQTLRTELT
jgi:pimeloyl-ACP methyl ester carboxylesterase